MGAGFPTNNPPDFGSPVSTDESVERGRGLFEILASRPGDMGGVSRVISGRRNLLM